MRIILADDGIAFDGRDVASRPMGGAESCVAWLAEAFAARGHDIHCYTRCRETATFAGVSWHPIADGVPLTADLFIANRGNRVLPLVPRARAMAFWIHNPAQYLNKFRYLWPLAKRRPTSVFLSRFHASTAGVLLPTRKAVIPHGVHPAFAPQPSAPPPPRAVYLSNPLRGLDKTLDLWLTRVVPAVPGAELHLYLGASLMPTGEAARPEAQAILARAAGTPGVVLHDPVSRDELARDLRDFRLVLYPAQVEESFCLSVAELQALGIPAVVSDRGALPERVADGETGFVRAYGDAEGIAQASVDLLRDDALWARMHANLFASKIRRWSDVAADFEALARNPRTAG